MASFQQSKRSDNGRCIVEVRWGIVIEKLTSLRLTAGAWVACGSQGAASKQLSRCQVVSKRPDPLLL